MKALLLKDYKRLDYTDFPKPAPGPDEVLIRIRTCGICGSDIHGYDGSSGRRIPPIVMGHEAAGEIVEAGSEVTGWQPGDRVTFDSTVYCGKCSYCRAGKINLCKNRTVLGVSCGDYRQHGAFAEFLAVPQHILYRLPHALPYEKAAMVEAVSIAFHAVNRTPVQLDDTAVVVGTGMIGLLVVQALRIAGCGRIIAIDLEEKKLELAKELGATEGLNPAEGDAVEKVRELTDGEGADISFEVVGATPTVQTAVECVHKGGAVTFIGNLAPMVDLPLQSVVTRELTIHGTCGSCGEYPACLNMIASGAMNLDLVISEVAPLAEGAFWFDQLYSGRGNLMKVILRP